MRKCSALLTMIILAGNCFASSAEFEDAIIQAKNLGNSKKMDSFDKAKKFDSQVYFDNYTVNPDQSKYYSGVTQKDTHNMENDASISGSGKSGSDILNSINQHPHFVISQSDPDIARSQILQSEAYNITHGITSQYTDCKPRQLCKTEFQKKECDETPQATFQNCKKKLKIEVQANEKVTHYPLITHLSVKEHNYAGISFDAVTGRTDFLGPHDARFKMDGRLPHDIDCHTLLGTVTSRDGDAKLDYIYFPSCGTGLNITYHISGGHKLDLTIDMASKVVTYEVNDQWVDECTAISENSTCKIKSQQCDIPASTRIIEGLPVTRDCWQYGFDYICRNGSGEGNCKPLQAEGCEQIGSECTESSSNQCTLYHQVYQCPVQSCSPTSDVICGNGQDYCLDGNCTDSSYQPSEDFGKAVSALSAAVDAGKQFDQGLMAVFTGHPSECSEKPIGYSNCCSESGWGQDIGLDNCPDAAKKLHVDREKKRAIKVGRYCSGSEPFPCLEHAQVFCVFDSKLAKIIQEQGRFGQLNLNFGSAKNPKCDGITPDQLQSVDFSKINFQDYINELGDNVKRPDFKNIQEMIQRHVDQLKQTGQANA